MTTLPLSPSALTQDAVEDLRIRIRGDVLVAGDAGYDETRTGFNLLFDQRPAITVVAEGTDDVATAVRFAAAAGLKVAVKATGHGTARPADADTLLIETSRMTDVTIDPVARTARIESGAKWAAVLPQAQEHGLAPLVGSTTDVGAVGYTLGGGLGWLSRRYGLCSDSVRSFELVTPDGLEVTASATVNPGLFWALKGGSGGALGVVTAMEIDLFPVSTVYAGNLFYPAELAGEVMRRFRTWAAENDPAMSSSVLVINFPPLEIVPEPLRGRSFVIVRGCWSGEDLDAGRERVDEWRRWRAPELDMFGPMPFAMADTISQDPTDPMPSVVDTEWLEELSDEAIDIVLGAAMPAPGAPPVLTFAEFRHAGAAVRAGAADAANDLGRTGEFLLEIVGVPPAPELLPVLQEHIRRTRAALAPYVTGAAYLNFLDGEEKHRRSTTAFSPANLAKLQRIKAVLDPQDRFAHGFGIPLP